MYGNEACSPEMPVPAIAAASTDLTRANARLATSIERLTDRLSPVLREETVGAGSDSKEPAYNSPLAREIQTEARYVRGLADCVDCLIGRLEI